MDSSYNNRNDMIIKHLPLVKSIVNRIDAGDSGYDSEDLVSIGVIGLMDAIEKYDHSKNVPFEAYASIRIRGSVIDELRKSGRVSRDKIDKLNQYYLAKEDLERKLYRTPKESEICEEMGIDRSQLSKLHETVNFLSRTSLESTIFSLEGNDIQLKDVIKDENAILPEDGMVKNEQRKLLVSAISSLKEREQIILNLYYVEELTFKEISYTLDISIPRLSQIHGKILMKLRELMRNDLEENSCTTF